MAGFSFKHGLIAVATAGAMFSTSAILPAQAALVSTESVIQTSAAQAEREQVASFMARQDVQDQMRAMGISPEEANARIAALSDAEIRQIAGQIEDVPAGGDALGVVVGAAVLIFIVLLITDIAGLTKVFPWTRSAR